jgi:hypothetical protein
MKLTGAVLAVAFAVAGLSRAATAQTETSSHTFLVYAAPTLKHPGLSPSENVLSFSVPVEIPGARLPAGVYIFRLLGPSIVQVQSITRSRVYATFLTIPASEVGDTRRERIKFEVSDEDRPPRIVAWYQPGSTGHEFLYPKSKREAAIEPEEREAREETASGWRR